MNEYYDELAEKAMRPVPGDRVNELLTELGLALSALSWKYKKLTEYSKNVDKLLYDAELKLEKMRKSGKAKVKCAKCRYWRLDMDDETGKEIHRCVCDAAPKLDDVTEGEDGCEYGKRKTAS